METTGSRDGILYRLGFQNVAVDCVNGVAALTDISYKKM